MLAPNCTITIDGRPTKSIGADGRFQAVESAPLSYRAYLRRAVVLEKNNEAGSSARTYYKMVGRFVVGVALERPAAHIKVAVLFDGDSRPQELTIIDWPHNRYSHLGQKIEAWLKDDAVT